MKAPYLHNGFTGFINNNNEKVITGSMMGREDNIPNDYTTVKKLYLEKVPMSDCGCYDAGGAYWGLGGNPLFCAWAAADGLSRGDPRPALQGFAARTISPRGLAARLINRAPGEATDMLFLRSRCSRGLFNREFLDRHSDRRVREFASRGASVGDEMTRMTLASNLPYILRYTDRASMHFGMEARSPFLDYRVVEAGLRASTDQLANARQTKMLLRDAFSGHLPEDLRNRRKYAGFGSTEEMSFASVTWRRVWDEAPGWAGDYVDVDALRAALARGDNDLSIWNALSFLIWACVASNDS